MKKANVLIAAATLLVANIASAHAGPPHALFGVEHAQLAVGWVLAMFASVMWARWLRRRAAWTLPLVVAGCGAAMLLL